MALLNILLKIPLIYVTGKTGKVGVGPRRGEGVSLEDSFENSFEDMMREWKGGRGVGRGSCVGFLYAAEVYGRSPYMKRCEDNPSKNFQKIYQHIK